MSGITRRDFIRRSAAGIAGLSASSWARVLGANDAVRVGVVGVHGQGNYHVKLLHETAGVRVIALCDPDQDVLDKRAKEWKEKAGLELRTYQDVRKLLENKEIDAVSIAAPNHWHALATVWACQAGKDVYVEKPASHNVFEGRKAVEAARKYGRIVQHGTQRRSSKGHAEACRFLAEGGLGDILWSRGFCYKRRGSIGKVDGPQEPPKSVDYDLWTGPAPLKPLMRKSLHYDWHWVWDTGSGDIGNQGVHEMDFARRALGDPGLPPRVVAVGGRFGYVDDGETPNTQIVFFDYSPAPLVFEVQGLPVEKGADAMGNYRGVRIGNVVQCEGGHISMGEGGGWAYDKDGKKMRQFTEEGSGRHFGNWIGAIRSRKAEDLTADIEKGHLSAALCHLGNVSYRVGEATRAKKITKAIGKIPELSDSFGRFLEHLEKNGMKAKKEDIILGPALEFDPAAERFTGALAGRANELITRDYRAPFVVPREV